VGCGGKGSEEMKNFNPKVFKDKQKMVVVFHGLCKGCGLCIEKCPQKAISFSKTNLGVLSTPTVEIDIEKCTACGICETVCPDSALKVRKNK
jgi:2-oxoglutarate ferredoxin oxidoreductase subunit delta